MGWTDDAIKDLGAIGGQLASCRPDDNALIIKLGAALEGVMKRIPADNAAHETVKLALQSLITVYQKLAVDPARLFQAMGLAIDAVAKHISSESSDGVVLKNAQEEMKAEMLRKAGEPEKPFSTGGQTSPTASQPVEQQPAGQTESVASSPGDICRVIDDIAALLMTLAPDAVDNLRKVHDMLSRCIEISGLKPLAADKLADAASLLDSLIQGQSPDAPAAIHSACDAVGQASAIQEKDDAAHTAEPQKGQPAASSPAATAKAPPAQAAPTKPAQSAAPKQAQAFDIPTGPSILPADTDMTLLKEYIVESLDHITAAEAALLELESNPQNSEQINVVFRAFHTIKGTSGFINLDRIQKLAHLAENMLDRARSGQIVIQGGYADLALKSCDSLRIMIEALRGAEAGGELEVPDTYAALMAQLADPEGAGISGDSSTEPLRLGDILVAKGVVSREAIETTVSQKGNKPLGEALVESGAAQATEIAKALRTQKQITGTDAEATVRVGTTRLDSLINMVGELVIAQSMVAQDPDVLTNTKPRLTRNVSHAGKIIRELQDLTMSLRMVPLKATFQKMARLVRDLGKKAGKQVQFVTEGDDTEIDRNMVEILGDPLVHMVRNAVDHGIEQAEVRREKGKSELGTVTLRAYHSAGNVVIELQDDGKGLDRDRIVAKATEKGLIDPSREMSDSEIFNLIFLPGFSTAEKVTDVSGRGVGMDVVKKNIEKLRGRVDMHSIFGKGSTFSIRLPLTMAITDGMLLGVGEQRYLLPTVSISQSFRPSKGTISSVTGRGEMVQLRGQLLPIFRLHTLFGVGTAITDPYTALLIVIEGNGKSCALMVDELLGQQQVVIKSLGESFGSIPGVAGGAILGDGRVGLILDAAGLIQLAELPPKTEAVQPV